MAGRPSKYTDELAETLCTRVADGESLRDICSEDGMPDRKTVRNWLIGNVDFSARWAQAREAQGDAMDDKILDAARRVDVGELDPNAAKVIISAYQWRASKLQPKRYGDRLDLAVTGELKSMTDEQVEAKLAALMAKTEVKKP